MKGDNGQIVCLGSGRWLSGVSVFERPIPRGRISARRAATLAYITSLLLRSLPAIDRDRLTGISAAFKAQSKSTGNADAGR